MSFVSNCYMYMHMREVAMCIVQVSAEAAQEMFSEFVGKLRQKQRTRKGEEEGSEDKPRKDKKRHKKERHGDKDADKGKGKDDKHKRHSSSKR